MIHYNLFTNDYHFSFKIRGVIQKILREIYHFENLKGEYVVSFIIVSNDEIQEINKTYRHLDRPTDVISFAGIDSNENHKLDYELGDIYISYDKVLSQAEEYNHSILREFSFLLTHGMLHLLGYDHMNKHDEEIMFNKQDEILENIKILRDN